MSLSELLFSFKGRISRGSFWTAQILLSIVVVVVLAAIILGTPVTGISGIQDRSSVLVLMVIVLAVTSWVSLAICTKRWHDIGWSGWMNLTLLIPYIGIVFWLILGIQAGTVESNIYGEAPEKTAHRKVEKRLGL